MGDLINSLKHPAFAAARESLGEAGAARATSFAVEGAKLLREGLAVSAPLERAFFLHPREKADEEAWEAAHAAGLETWEVTRGVSSACSGLAMRPPRVSSRR